MDTYLTRMDVLSGWQVPVVTEGIARLTATTVVFESGREAFVTLI